MDVITNSGDPLRVIQLPMSFYPDRGGGETYVGGLAHALTRKGVEVSIAAPGERDVAYHYEGLSVQRFAIATSQDQVYQNIHVPEDQDLGRRFGSYLDAQAPDIVHLHARRREIAGRFMDEIKRRRIPTIFTYHAATITCLRGDLMRWGKELCTGIMDADHCSRCFSHSLGLPRVLSAITCRVPNWFSKRLGSSGLTGKAITALRMREITELSHDTFRRFLFSCDRIIALAPWAQSLLIQNGVPAEKVIFSPIGLVYGDEALKTKISQTPSHLDVAESRPLRCACVGSFHPYKGAQILIQAIKKDPHLAIELHLYGVAIDPKSEAHLKNLKKQVGDDTRIRFLGPIPDAEVVQRLREYDVLAISSQIMETGPFLALEAFAAGVPVIGSRIGGIADLVANEVDGLLVEPSSVNAWHDAFVRISSESGLLQRLRSGIRPPRTMDQVSDEMMQVYRSVLREPV